MNLNLKSSKLHRKIYDESYFYYMICLWFINTIDTFYKKYMFYKIVH